jgi:hypothetical protein
MLFPWAPRAIAASGNTVSGKSLWRAAVLSMQAPAAHSIIMKYIASLEGTRTDYGLFEPAEDLRVERSPDVARGAARP